jgi:hypothetical protein
MLAGSITADKLSTGAPTWNAGGTLTATSFNGNASTATSAARLTTPRTIGLSGDVTGTASFDGSANATIASTIANLPNGIVIASKLGTNEQKQIAKAWGRVSSTGAFTGGTGYGINTATRVTQGVYSITLSSSYSEIVAVASPEASGTGWFSNAQVTLPSTITVRVFNSANNPQDAAIMLAVFAN